MEDLILQCIVRSALIALCSAAALYILRVNAARVRHDVWASVVVIMPVLPVWTAFGPKAVLRVLKPASAIATVQPRVEPIQQEDVSAAVVRPAILWTWQDSVAAFYLLGLFALSPASRSAPRTRECSFGARGSTQAE